MKYLLILLLLSLLYENILCYLNNNINIRNRYSFNNKNVKNNIIKLYDETSAVVNNIIDLPVTLLPISVLITSFGLFKFIVYSRMQFVTASMIGGIPPKSSICEIDAIDGKNIFYLSKECDYTAIMPIKEIDPKKIKDKLAINEQLILESIGKANIGGLKLSGKIRQKTQDIATKTIDTVISVGALSRSNNAYETLMEINRILRPGGLFVFVEPANTNNGETIKTIESIFPKEIISIESAGTKIEKAKAKEAKKSKNNKKIPKNDLETFSNIDDENKVEEVEVNTINQNDNNDVNTKPIVRPGLTYELLQNVIDPYVTGIGIKP